MTTANFAQVNRYTQVTPPAQYNAMSTSELLQLAEFSKANEKARNEAYSKRVANFNKYQSAAMDALTKKRYHDVVNYCNQALATNLSNSDIYFLRASGYLNLGFKKDGKKDLKKASKMGSSEAKYLLREIKKL
jgi:hypothetical protein